MPPAPRRILFAGLALLATAARAAAPAELTAALAAFRQDPPPGWSYTQTAAAGGRSTVERCDAARPEFDRWTLAQKDGRTPTADEVRVHRETRTQRSRGGTAPRLSDQLDAATARLTAQDAARATYECRLQPSDAGDRTAAHLVATIVVHRPTGTVERVVLANKGAFRPALGVEITSLRTELAYDPPAEGRPALPRAVTTRVRGTAFWLKSLDDDMTITFTDYARAKLPSKEMPATSGPR